MFYPIGLHFVRQFEFYTHVFQLRFVFGIVSIVLLFYLLVIRFWKNMCIFSPYVFGLGWFFLSLAPVSGIFPINSIYAERWLYIPITGVIFVLMNLFQKVKYRVFRCVVVVICALLLIFNSVLLVKRNFEWAHPLDFFENELVYNNNSALIYNQLALVYIQRGELNKAEEYLKIGASLKQDVTQLYFNLALLLEQKGDFYFAIDNLRIALKLHPDFMVGYRLLYQIFLKMGLSVNAGQVSAYMQRVENNEIPSSEEIDKLFEK